jgi:hypothetical protein
MINIKESKGSTTPRLQKTDPLTSVPDSNKSSKSSGVPKQEPLSTIVDDYYLQIMQRPCKERLKVETLNISYSICLEEDMWLDCVVEE